MSSNSVALSLVDEFIDLTRDDFVIVPNLVKRYNNSKSFFSIRIPKGYVTDKNWRRDSILNFINCNVREAMFIITPTEWTDIIRDGKLTNYYHQAKNKMCKHLRN